MSAIVFGEADPRRYIVPESECMACRHPVDDHGWGGDDHRGCDRCDCALTLCWVHDSLHDNDDCDAEGEL